MKTTYKTEELRNRTQVLRLHIFDSVNNELNPAQLQLLKVNKAHAERLYNSGHTIFIHPCKMRLNNMWQSPYQAQRNEQHPEEFKKVDAQYTYYNCDNERGKYPNYFAVLNYAGDNKYQIVKQF